MPCILLVCIVTRSPKVKFEVAPLVKLLKGSCSKTLPSVMLVCKNLQSLPIPIFAHICLTILNKINQSWTTAFHAINSTWHKENMNIWNSIFYRFCACTTCVSVSFPWRYYLMLDSWMGESRHLHKYNEVNKKLNFAEHPNISPTL